MATLTLNIQVNSADAKEYAASEQPQRCLGNAARLLQGLASGNVIGSVDVQRSSSDPVAATGTLTITNASVAANDTVTIGGIVLTAKSSGASGAQFNIGADATATGDNLVAAIAAHATLGKVLTAANAAGTVTVTCNEKGLVGNLIGLASSNGTGIAVSASTLASGAGGAQGAAVTYGR
jgi:phage tail sheath gpL-like